MKAQRTRTEGSELAEPSRIENANPVPKRLGAYRIEAVLGRSGMGAVYQGTHEQTGEMVAVKTVLLPHRYLLQSLRREIAALARLRHPGIVRIVGEGVVSGLPWYAMELVEGVGLGRFTENLRARSPEVSVPQQGRLAPTQAEPGTQRISEVASHTRLGDTVWTDLVPTDLSPHALQPPMLRVGSSPLSEESLRRILGLGRRLSLTLAYLHGEGVVHRDLKPGNILVRSEKPQERREASAKQDAAVPGTPVASVLTSHSSLLASPWPVLVDFGLAVDWPFARLEQAATGGLDSRETLETGLVGSGTLAYMAPEQRNGSLVDARADLYALGALLYELLDGRRLFTKQGPQNPAGKKLVPGTQLPEGWDATLPPRVVPLLLRLLATEPHHRIGYASTVAAMLQELGAEEDTSSDLPRSQAYLYRPRFVGRKEVLLQLRRTLARMEDGSGSVVLLTGESGCGKTRLAMELCAKALLRGTEVILGHCTNGPSGSVLQGLRQPLRNLTDRCREGGETETRRLFGEHARLLGQYEPALLDLPGVADLPEPLPLPPAQAGLRLFKALGQTFAALSERTPLVLALDDLQWADELTLGFLEFLSSWGPLQSQRLLLIGTVRSEETSARLAQLAHSQGVLELRLDRLETTEIGQMIQEMLALPNPSAQFVDFLVRKSEGNPLFIAEYLRSAVAQGVLFQDTQGHWCVHEPTSQDPQTAFEHLGLPRSVQGLMAGRLAALTAPARRLVEIAAVLGRDMQEDLLFAVAGSLLGEVLAPLDELMTREVLEPLQEEIAAARPGSAEGIGVERGLGEGRRVRFRFLHESLRQAAYQAIESERLAHLHRAAAEAIEQQPASQREAIQAELGFHWQQAGDRRRARSAYRAAATRAQQRSALQVSESLCRTYLRLTDESDAESLDVQNDLASSVLYPLGRSVEARQLALEIRERARDGRFPQAEVRALYCLGMIAWRTGEGRDAQALMEHGFALCREHDLTAFQGHFLSFMGNVALQQSRLSDARNAYQQALGLARQLNNRSQEALNLANLALVEIGMGNLSQGFVLLEQATEHLRQLGDRPRLAVCLQNLGLHSHRSGYLERAVRCLNEALSLQREMGDLPGQVYTLYSLGQINSDQRLFLRAREHFETMMRLARAANEARGLILSLEGLSGVELLEGELEKCRSLLGEFQSHLKPDLPDLQILWRLRQARFERLTGSIETAGRRLERARVLLRRNPDPEKLGMAMCEQGHQRLARGRSAARRLLLARKVVAEFSMQPEAPLAVDLRQLERAEAAFQAGQPLLWGQCPEDLPQALQAWQDPRETNQDSRRSSVN